VHDVAEIKTRLEALAGSSEEAEAWFTSQPIPAFGGRTAEAVVQDGHATALCDYLDHIAVGGFA
jgi:hypothetical protein